MAKASYMLTRLLWVYRMTKYVGKILLWNSKRPLRKLENILGDYFFAAHCRYIMYAECICAHLNYVWDRVQIVIGRTAFWESTVYSADIQGGPKTQANSESSKLVSKPANYIIIIFSLNLYVNPENVTSWCDLICDVIYYAWGTKLLFSLCDVNDAIFQNLN